MPQTALMGPDGQQAKDMRGTPLTMEEMLRRNGIVQMGNTTSMIGPSGDGSATANTGVPVAGDPTSATGGTSPAVVAAMQARSGGSASGATDSPIDATGAQGDPTATAQQLADSGMDENTVDMLEKLGVIAVGTGAAYLAYRALKGRGGGAAAPGSAGTMASTSNGTAGSSGVPSVAGQAGDNIPYAEYTEVDQPKRVGDSTKRAMQGRSAANKIEGRSEQKALPKPQPKLENNGRTAAGQAMQARAARGGPTDVGTVEGLPPVRTLREPADAGALRTLGIPQGVIEMLKANPGLARTLGRH